MKRASKAALALVLMLGVLSVPRPARAQTAEDRESARRLFDEGKARRDKGDAAGALESFRAADALMNVPTTKLAVARTYVALGKLVEARDAAMAVAQIPVAANEPAPFTDARAASAQLATEIAGRIPSITITIQGDDPESVIVDGASVPREAWRAPRRVNPGKHTAVATLGSRQAAGDVVVAEGENASIVIELHAPSQDDVPQSARGGAPSSRPLPTLFWIGGGVGVAGIAMGTIAGVVSLSNKHAADSFCRDGKCPPPAYASLDAANTWASVSTGAFIAAGAGAALAVVSLALRPSPVSPTSATVLLRPGGADLVGSF
jgi:hypothetical protein